MNDDGGEIVLDILVRGCSVFGFGQAYLSHGDLVLGPRQFHLITDSPEKMLLTIKVVKRDSKTIILPLLPRFSINHCIFTLVEGLVGLAWLTTTKVSSLRAHQYEKMLLLMVNGP